MWLFWCIYFSYENITVAADDNTDIAFKNCAPFSTCATKINDAFVDEANHIYIVMPLYNLIECSNNHSNTSGSLWQFKRDEVPALLGKTANAVANTNSSVKEQK